VGAMPSSATSAHSPLLDSMPGDYPRPGHEMPRPLMFPVT
jgi:hypothetical protein